MKAIAAYTFFLLVMAHPAIAADTAPSAPVRVQSSGIDDGWHEGKMGASPAGCTMVYLRSPSRVGTYTSLAVNGLDRLQQVQGGAWVDLPIKPLLAREPRDCREASDD